MDNPSIVEKHHCHICDKDYGRTSHNINGVELWQACDCQPRHLAYFININNFKLVSLAEVPLKAAVEAHYYQNSNQFNPKYDLPIYGDTMVDIEEEWQESLNQSARLPVVDITGVVKGFVHFIKYVWRNIWRR